MLKLERRSVINNLSLHLKKVEKEEQIKPKVSTAKETINISVEINKIKTIHQKNQQNQKLIL